MKQTTSVEKVCGLKKAVTFLFSAKRIKMHIFEGLLHLYLLAIVDHSERLRNVIERWSVTRLFCPTLLHHGLENWMHVASFVI
jgi:hypothetical protein